MIEGKKHTAMICDREHPYNGTMRVEFGPKYKYLIYPLLPAIYTDMNDASLDEPIKEIVLHYGTFNGVAVWTREKVET